MERMKSRGREAKHLGVTLRDEPRSFPAAVLDLMRRSFRTVWKARGGGLYACGFVITFVYLEIRMFVVDIFEAESVSGYITEQAMEMVFKYFGESIRNMIAAFMWPVPILQFEPPWGVLVLVLMFILFGQFLKAPLERWLFRDDVGPADSEPEAEPRP
jgi:hypothetical protein